MKHTSTFNNVPLNETFVILFTGSFLVENKSLTTAMRFEVQPTFMKTGVLLRDIVCLIEVHQQFSENFCLHLQGRTKMKYSPRNFDSKLSQPRRQRCKFVAPWGNLNFI